MIALLVMTDGRADCLRRTMAAARDALTGPVTHLVIHDDSGDPEYGTWLADWQPSATILSGESRRGFGGAIAAAWAYLERTDVAFVFHLEDDFVINRPVRLEDMAAVLSAERHLVQLALRRQPWNDAERAAGGIVEQRPEAYVERTRDGHAWLEHELFFTTNPSLYRRSLTTRGWPDGEHSEGRFGIELRDRHPDARFAFWGSRDSGEWCQHIGHERVGTGY